MVVWCRWPVTIIMVTIIIQSVVSTMVSTAAAGGEGARARVRRLSVRGEGARYGPASVHIDLNHKHQCFKLVHTSLSSISTYIY